MIEIRDARKRAGPRAGPGPNGPGRAGPKILKIKRAGPGRAYKNGPNGPGFLVDIRYVYHILSKVLPANNIVP